MTVEISCRSLLSLPLRTNDRNWFPKWIRRYAASLPCRNDEPLPVTEDSVLRFLRSLRDRGVPAWQRLQGVRAVEAYQSNIVNRGA